MLLVRKGCKTTCCLTDFNITQRLGKGTDVVFDKLGIERFVLMALDNVGNNLVRELDKVFFRPWLGGYQRIEFGR